MRLFVAIEIESAIREGIARFAAALEESAPEARWARQEGLHVTLKFIGEREGMDEIHRALAQIRVRRPIKLNFCGLGFFPSERRPRVFWVGIEADESLQSLAAEIDDALAPLGIERERRPYTPHLTLARGAEPRKMNAHREKHGIAEPQPTHAFARLKQKLARFQPPSFGTMSAQEFFLYQSTLTRGRAEYTKLAAFGRE